MALRPGYFFAGNNLNDGQRVDGEQTLREVINQLYTQVGGETFYYPPVVTTHFLAERLERIRYNASGGTFTIVAPNAPDMGDKFGVKEYIGDTPQSKIRIFESGDPNLEYNYEVLLLAKNKCEIKSEALESIRLHINRNLSWKLSKSKFYFKLPIYPHQIVRRHGWLGFAGADRISKGMKLAFGKPKHRVALVKNGQVIANVKVVSKEDVKVVREILKGAVKKIPAKGEIVIKEMV